MEEPTHEQMINTYRADSDIGIQSNIQPIITANTAANTMSTSASILRINAALPVNSINSAPCENADGSLFTTDPIVNNLEQMSVHSNHNDYDGDNNNNNNNNGINNIDNTNNNNTENNTGNNNNNNNNNNLNIGNESIAIIDIELGKEAFKHTVSLSVILSEIQSTIYTPKAMMAITQIEELLTIAKPLQLKLRQWYHSLPKSLQMGSTTPGRFSANGNLQLSYFATEITLHRRIISLLYDQSLSYKREEGKSPASNMSDGNSTSSHANTKVCPATPQLVMVCRNAAKTRLIASISFVRQLNTEHMQSFWHSSAVRNFALIGIFATLLYVTSSTSAEALVYSNYIMEYRWILKKNSSIFGIAKEALTLIDGVVASIPGLLNDYDDNGIELNSNDPNVNMNLTSEENNNNNSDNSNNTNNNSTNDNMGSPASNVKKNFNISKTYNYDSSNGVSPKTMLSPNQNDNNAKIGKRICSNLNTPINSPYPPSPLQDINNSCDKTGKQISNKNKPKSPILLMAQRKGNTNSNPNENDNGLNTSTIKSTMPVTTSTRSLFSQSGATTPTQSNNSAATSTRIHEMNKDKQDHEHEHEHEYEYEHEYEHKTKDKEINSRTISLKERAENLFKYDGQQSLLKMTTALGITSNSSEGTNSENNECKSDQDANETRPELNNNKKQTNLVHLEQPETDMFTAMEKLMGG